MVEQAIILAAGRGSRLAPVQNGTPKCLTSIGKRPLIQHQIDALRTAGVRRIAVVVGYGDAQVRSHLGPRCTFIRNAIWGRTNSLYSLALASRWVEGPFVVLNSDVLAHPGIFRRLLDGPPSALAYDSASGGDEEHMKVRLRRGTLRAIGKHLPPDDIHGENLGILKFDRRTGRLLFREIKRLLAAGQRTLWAPEVLNQVAHEADVHGVDVAGMPWIEIDFPADLERAQREVWPRIAAATAATGDAPTTGSASA